jgi:hypothetical protein
VFHLFVLCSLYLTFALAAAEFQPASISVGVGAKGLEAQRCYDYQVPLITRASD